MEPTSESRGSFFHRSIDKVANSKALRFISSNPSNDEPSEHGADAALNKKQHRRAQVRKAQIEHRQRKEIRIKDLEQEIINLRDLINSAEQQAGQTKHENGAMKSILVQSNIPIALTQNVPSDLGSRGAGGFGESIIKPLPLPEVSQWYPESSAGSVASISFDEAIGTSCLHFSSGSSHASGSEAILSSPDIFTFPDVSFTPNATTTTPPPNFQATSTPSPLPNQPHDLDAENNSKWATEAINFILALEHPCKTHFRPKDPAQAQAQAQLYAAQNSTLNAAGAPAPPPAAAAGAEEEEDNPSGHELMASTPLYSHAPTSIFASVQHNPDPTTYTPSWPVPVSSPASELTKLYQMSASLSKEDWEITPVQAWFLLVGRLGVARLMGQTTWAAGGGGGGVADGSVGAGGFHSGSGSGNGSNRQHSVLVLDRLKAELGKFVDCFGFGAVINANVFWDVVRDFVEEDGRSP